jgi:hypothetical protein
MFEGIKSIFFKNKDSIAGNIWSQIGIPINLARQIGTHTDFTSEFLDDVYLLGYFNGYLNFMIKHFFNVKNDKGLIMSKVIFLLDPKFGDAKGLMGYSDILKSHMGEKDSKLATDDAFMTVAIMLNDPKAKSNFLDNKIYLEAQKFYDDGEFEKRAELQKKVLGSMGTGQNPAEMPRDFAVAYRVFELTFVKHLNKKFKCPNI